MKSLQRSAQPAEEGAVEGDNAGKAQAAFCGSLP